MFEKTFPQVDRREGKSQRGIYISVQRSMLARTEHPGDHGRVGTFPPSQPPQRSPPPEPCPEAGYPEQWLDYTTFHEWPGDTWSRDPASHAPSAGLPRAVPAARPRGTRESPPHPPAPSDPLPPLGVRSYRHIRPIGIEATHSPANWHHSQHSVYLLPLPPSQSRRPAFGPSGQ